MRCFDGRFASAELEQRWQACSIARFMDRAENLLYRPNCSGEAFAGRKVVEKEPGSSLIDATGLSDDFMPVLRSVVKLRDNLLRTTQGEPAKR